MPRMDRARLAPFLSRGERKGDCRVLPLFARACGAEKVPLVETRGRLGNPPRAGEGEAGRAKPVPAGGVMLVWLSTPLPLLW